ncbi:MAG: ABC transporter ATP-binding protein [Chloroflexota bacterium]
MAGEFAIEIRDLHKNYGDIYAVQGIDLQIRNGEIFSLLGPNGAGKTTTISMLCGLLQPTQGDASIMGHSVRTAMQSAKTALGVVPQDIAIYPDLSARENLMFWGRMYGLRGDVLKARVAQVLELIGLTSRASGQAGKFSGGMKRRLNIGIALLHQPKVVIMDEPTVGIDPQSRRSILDGVKELNRQGMTVLYTTHYMEEAQEISDQIAIMDHGKVIAQGTNEELVKIIGGLDRIRLTLSQESAALTEAWRATPGVRHLREEEGTLELMVEDSNVVLPRLFEAAGRAGVRITSVQIEEPNLEAVFLHLTGRALRD